MRTCLVMTGWAVAACAALLNAASPEAPAAADTSDWKLVWSDEFECDGAPDPAKWSYEEGFVRNQELQFYTRDRRENARVEKGLLVIEARREDFKDPHAKREAKFTSASLVTKGKAAWTCGRIEVRAKLPAARGTWPAIWMLGADIDKVGWPACGEIDILEFVGHVPDVVHANVHTRDFNHTRGNGRGHTLKVPNLTDDFHVYSLEWTPERIDIQFDGKTYFTLKNDGMGRGSWPFDQPHYLILNLAIGGSWGGQKGVDEAAFPQKLLVDYVRVYQRPPALHGDLRARTRDEH